MHKLPLPNGALYPLQTLLAAGAIFGIATLAHGSGFLAVFVAGILVGDLRAPYKLEIERFHASLASLAEIVAFILLGFTVSIATLVHDGSLLAGLGLAALLAVVVRPLLVGVTLLPIRLGWGERLFVMWSGLKGAVPILLGTYILTAGVPDAHRLYDIVVVVVAFSVIVQGGLVPTAARWTGVPMRVVDPEPLSLGMRFREQPTGLNHYQVGPGSAADGTSVVDLPLGESSWISMINRSGRLVPVRPETVLQAGDEVLLLAEATDVDQLRTVFTEPTRGPGDPDR